MTSIDLQSRVHLRVHGYQFQLADNRCDLNFLWLDVQPVHRRRSAGVMRTRAINWELSGIADALDDLSRNGRSEWRSKLLDSGLSVRAERHSERGDAYVLTFVTTELGGPLPATLKLRWDGDMATGHRGQVHALRIVCSRAALRLFAADLRATLDTFPVRKLPDDRLHLGQPRRRRLER